MQVPKEVLGPAVQEEGRGSAGDQQGGPTLTWREDRGVGPACWATSSREATCRPQPSSGGTF